MKGEEGMVQEPKRLLVRDRKFDAFENIHIYKDYPESIYHVIWKVEAIMTGFFLDSPYMLSDFFLLEVRIKRIKDRKKMKWKIEQLDVVTLKSDAKPVLWGNRTACISTDQ